MSRTTTQRIQTFTAHSKAGSHFVIHVYQQFHEGRTNSGTYRTPGLTELRTDSGDFVNYIAKGQYTVGSAGIPATSDDPAAP